MADIDKKIQDQAIVENDADIGTAADVDEIMKKYDRESNVRIWEGVPKQIVRFVLAAFMLFMVYMNLWATWSGQIRRCLFVGMVVLFTFFVYPAKKGDVKPNHMPWYDILLAIVGCIPFFYYVANFKKIVAMGIAIGQTEVILGIIGILYFGANKIGSGALLSGDVVALVNYMSQILVELVKLANLVVLLTRAIASMGRVSQVLDTPSTMAFPEKPVSADAASDVAVAFSHVSLRYQGAGAESLSDVTFTAKKGQTIGVIGGTGSGKTTLVSLIPRFYDATKGQVTLLGQPITAYSKAELNRHVAVVMQKAQLFKGTIRSNLLWGNENATDEELWHALSIAQSEDFVRQKPGKLDDPVEQGGRNLSGGQRQRLTIARALVGHPDILILDDSASALDYATDAALRKALRTLPAETTLFIVSQRTSSLRHADQIIVLDDGHVVGIGKHDALMQTCEVYREIHESQFRKGSDVQ